MKILKVSMGNTVCWTDLNTYYEQLLANASNVIVWAMLLDEVNKWLVSVFFTRLLMLYKFTTSF